MSSNDAPTEEWIKKEYPKMYGALFGDGLQVRQELMAASLFIMTFECLRESVEGHFKSFFMMDFEIGKDGKFIYAENDKFREVKEKYQEQYRVLAKRLSGADVKRVNIFQAACAWFYDMGGLSDDDMIVITSSIALRNDFAHELYKWLMDDKLPRLGKNFVNGPLSLHFKISNWWIRNFEQSIAPEDYEQYSEEDMQSAASMNAHFLQLLINKTFPEEG